MDADCPNDHLILGIGRKEIKKVRQRISAFDYGKCTKCGLCGEVCRQNAIVSVRGNNPIFMESQCNGCGACKVKCPSGAISWGEKEIGKVYSGKVGGLDFISGELKINEPVSERIISEIKEKIGNDYDFVIVDTAAGTHCDVIAALEGCDTAFAVTEPSPLGAHDLGLILELAREIGIDCRIVLNRADLGRRELIDKIMEKQGSEIAFEIPYSEEIVSSYSKGEPIRIEGIKKLAERIKG
jgi:MinD superfamily P-loop ATPase